MALLSSSASDKSRSSNWFETPTLSLGQKAGVAQLEPGNDGQGGLRFGWKRVSQDRSELRLQCLHDRELVMPATFHFPAPPPLGKNTARLTKQIKYLNKRHPDVSLPFGLLDMIGQQDAYASASWNSIQSGNLLATCPLPTPSATDHVLLHPLGTEREELGAALCQQPDGNLLQTSATATPLRSGRRSILQLDASDSAQFGPIIGLRNSKSTRLMQLDLFDEADMDHLMPTDIQCHPLSNITPAHTHHRHHIDLALEKRCRQGSHDRALVLNAAGALFEFDIHRGESTCLMSGEHASRYIHSHLASESLFGRTAFVPDHPDLCVVAFPKDFVLVDKRAGPSKSTKLLSPEDAPLYRNRIHDMNVSLQSPYPTVLTSGHLALLDPRSPGHPVLQWAHHREPRTTIRMHELDMPSDPHARRLMVFSRNNSMRQLFTFSTVETPTVSLLPPYQLPSDVQTSGLYTACSLPSALSDQPSTTLFELEMSGKLISSVYGAKDAKTSAAKTVFWDENVFELNKAAKVETTVTSKRYSARAVYQELFAPLDHETGSRHAMDIDTSAIEPSDGSKQLLKTTGAHGHPSTALELLPQLRYGVGESKSTDDHAVQQLIEQIDASHLSDEENSACYVASAGESVPLPLSALSSSVYLQQASKLHPPGSSSLAMAREMAFEEGLSQRILGRRTLAIGSAPSELQARALGHFPSPEETPDLSFGYLQPTEIENQAGNMAARLLASQWHVGTDALRAKYRNPMATEDEADGEAEDEFDYVPPSTAPPAVAPVSFSQPLPSRSSRPVVRFQEPDSQADSQTQQTSFNTGSSQMGSSQSMIPQVFSQIVPGQFGARKQDPPATAKKKKRKSGF